MADSLDQLRTYEKVVEKDTTTTLKILTKLCEMTGIDVPEIIYQQTSKEIIDAMRNNSERMKTINYLLRELLLVLEEKSTHTPTLSPTSSKRTSFAKSVDKSVDLIKFEIESNENEVKSQCDKISMLMSKL